MSNQAFSYLDDYEREPDAYDLGAESFKEKQKDEEIVTSNDYGNGFSPKTSPAGPYNPQELNARHREILRLHCLGYKGTEIANMLGCTPQTVYNTVNSPLGQSFIQEIEEVRTASVKDVHNRLQEMSPFATEVMLDILATGKEKNKLRAAEKILEMTGHKASNKHEHLHAHLTKDEIEELKETARGGPEIVEEDPMELPAHNEEEQTDE